jgi:uncharacterized protein (DUF362 family)
MISRPRPPGKAAGVDSLRKNGHHESGMPESRVVVVGRPGILAPSGDLETELVRRAIERGFCLLTGETKVPAAVARLFRPADRVGIKVNTIGGPLISTRPETALALAQTLIAGGIPAGQIAVWDRTNRELRAAGYRLAEGSREIRILGTDTAGVGYGRDLVSHRGIGSLFSALQADFATASISLAILKDHGMAGITAGLKNYFGAVHNPNKYHDNHCDPFVAEVFDVPLVREKHRLTVVDALRVQFHRGPSFHAKWADACGQLIFSLDPVAADSVGRDLLERLRRAKGLPSLREEGREPGYLATAEGLKLGRARREDITLVEEKI